MTEKEEKMNGEERRRKLAEALGEKPLSATRLAEKFGVSRQVIVQDVALLRAEGKEIVSTNRGYILPHARVRRVFKVCHTDAQTRDELYLIVDAGGRVEDVFVRHKVYGRIRADLRISSRRDADAFLEKLAGGVSVPLKNITGDYHYHTVTAESEAVLDEIGKRLSEAGFLRPIPDLSDAKDSSGSREGDAAGR